MPRVPDLRADFPLAELVSGEINAGKDAHLAPVRIEAVRRHLWRARETYGDEIVSRVSALSGLSLLALSGFLRGQNFPRPCDDTTRCAQSLAAALAEREGAK